MDQNALSGSDLTNSTTFPFPSSADAKMANSQYPPADLSEVDESTNTASNAPEDAPAHQTGPTRGGRGRGRGRVYRGKGKIAKPAPAKPVSGRGRRHKVYESARAQAAHERIQELRSAFATVAKVVKPVVQEIADRSISDLIQDPALYQRVPEYQEIQSFLKSRLADTKRTLDIQFKTNNAMVKNLYAAQQQVARDEFARCLIEECDDRYDQLMAELDILEHLYDNNLPIDLPAPANEDEYLYKHVSQKQMDEQSGPYVKFQDGVEVPFHGKPVSELMTKDYQLPEDTPVKRKADGQPEGQPSAKIAAKAEGSDEVPTMPRHVSSMLSAVEALEDRASTPADLSSNTPTPAPEPADAPSPGNADQAPTSGERSSPETGEIPLPRNAAAPDEYGVRIITRRATRLDFPNNRIAVPNVFEWDDLDIGFRDSANCVQKGATKAKRGKYLGKPGSNYMFIDRRVGTWDSTQIADELDPELVKKYGLHPTLGFVLPTSVNEQEPPKPFVSGWKPTVLVSPSGETIHASRAIPAARHDMRARKVYEHLRWRETLREYCERDAISAGEVEPSQEERDEYRRSVLAAANIDPDVGSSQPRETAAVDDTAFQELVAALANEASAAEAEEEAARVVASSRSQPPSRPYDAIRDVFTTGAELAAPQVHTQGADTSKLLSLASIAEAEHAPERSYGQTEYAQQPNAYYTEPTTQLSYPQQMEHPGHGSPRPSDFLRTALNPPPTDYGPPPAVSDYPLSSMSSSPAPGSMSSGRSPFSNPGSTKALPALRPVRNLLNDASTLPEAHGSPAPQHPSMVMSNSGAFYPPAQNRSYHNSYPLQEPGAVPVLQPPVGGPFQVPQLAPSDRRSPFSLSPPPFQGMVAPGGGPAAILQQPGGPATMPPLQQPVSSSGASPHSRPGSSSASSGPSNAAAAGGKYRKLEPAPTPPHRQPFGGNGELRTVPFNYQEAIKDYTPVEAPPRHGPTHIRGWTHNSFKKAKVGDKEEEAL